MTDLLVAPGQTLVILGSGTSLRFAPFDDPACTFAGSSELWGKVPRLDVAITVYSERKLRAEALWEPLKTIPIPIYMQQVSAEIPTSRRYPLERVSAAFTVSARDRPFLTNTVSALLALALVQDRWPEAIRLYGVDMVQGTEYGEQRPSCEFFLGVCVGRNISLYVHPVSDLLKTQYLYGFEEDARAAQRRDLEERELWFHVQHDQTIVQIQALLTRLVHVRAVRADNKLHMARATL